MAGAGTDVPFEGFWVQPLGRVPWVPDAPRSMIVKGLIITRVWPRWRGAIQLLVAGRRGTPPLIFWAGFSPEIYYSCKIEFHLSPHQQKIFMRGADVNLYGERRWCHCNRCWALLCQPSLRRQLSSPAILPSGRMKEACETVTSEVQKTDGGLKADETAETAQARPAPPPRGWGRGRVIHKLPRPPRD